MSIGIPKEKTQQTPQPQVTEDAYRESLTEVLSVVETLGDYCATVDELEGMLRLAVGTDKLPGNDAQLRLLVAAMKKS